MKKYKVILIANYKDGFFSIESLDNFREYEDYRTAFENVVKAMKNDVTIKNAVIFSNKGTAISLSRGLTIKQ